MSEAEQSNRKQCESMTKAGQPCRAFALPGQRYCFSHSPEMAAQRQAAREKGGRNRSNLARARAATPPRLLPAIDQIEAALTDVIRGSLPASRATAAASLARALVALMTAGEFEDRLRQLEQQAEERVD